MSSSAHNVSAKSQGVGHKMINWKDISIDKSHPQQHNLGAGSFGRVIKALWKYKPELPPIYVAIKMIAEPVRKSGGEDFEKLYQAAIEEATLVRRAHEEIVATDLICKIYGIARGYLPEDLVKILPVTATEECVGIVMRYEVEGSLEDFLKTCKDGPTNLSMLEKLKVAGDVSRALAELHSIGIVHGDLKPENVLVSHRHPLSICLCDFGMSLFRPESLSQSISALTSSLTWRGTPSYAAPEILMEIDGDVHIQPSRTTDMYSFALLFFAILTGNRPFSKSMTKDREVFKRMVIEPEKRPNLDLLPADTPEEVRDILTLCWSSERQKRLSAGQCCASITAVIASLNARPAAPVAPVPASTASAPVSGVGSAPETVAKLPTSFVSSLTDAQLAELRRLIDEAGSNAKATIVASFVAFCVDSEFTISQVNRMIDEVGVKEKRMSDTKQMWYVKDQYRTTLPGQQDGGSAAAAASPNSAPTSTKNSAFQKMSATLLVELCRMLHMAGPAKKETIRDQFTFMHPVVKTTVVSKAIDEIAVKEKRSGDPKEVWYVKKEFQAYLSAAADTEDEDGGGGGGGDVPQPILKTAVKPRGTETVKVVKVKDKSGNTKVKSTVSPEEVSTATTAATAVNSSDGVQSKTSACSISSSNVEAVAIDPASASGDGKSTSKKRKAAVNGETVSQQSNCIGIQKSPLTAVSSSASSSQQRELTEVVVDLVEEEVSREASKQKKAKKVEVISVPELCKLIGQTRFDSREAVLASYQLQHPSVRKFHVDKTLDEVAVKEKRSGDLRQIWYVKKEYEQHIDA